MSLKDGSPVVLNKKTTSASLDLSNPGAALDTSNSPGWTQLTAGANTAQASVSCLWEDKIDVSGVQVADLSMRNLGAAGIVAVPPTKYNQNGHPKTVFDHLVVSCVPLNLTAAQWLFFTLGTRDLAGPVDMSRILVSQVSQYETNQNGGFVVPMIGQSSMGGARAFSTDTIYVYRHVAAYQTRIYDMGGAPVDVPADGGVFVADMDITIGTQLVEFDTISTAYAIYRGNDLQQSYDNS